MRLAGKVALITGAGSGLGRQCAQLFSSQGAQIAIVDIDSQRAEQTLDLINQQGGEAISLVADVAQKTEITAAVDAAFKHFGKLDIIFANAGVISRGGVPGVMGGEFVPFEDLTDGDWQHVLGINLSGVVYTIQAAVPHLKANGGGNVLATSSAASLVAYHNIALYSATKAGVNGLVRGLSLDLGRYGIRVNAIAPTHGMSPNFLMAAEAPVVGRSYEEIAGPWDPVVSPIPLKLNRPPSLVDNAKIALFLVSDDSAYISGATIGSTDGGSLARVGMWFEEDLSPQPL
ncbi:SDR family NAD(P)-dependent oxidoreductase [Mycolicibacterium sp. ELW1]|uniref:SDR family NAD(P)-dependent oxidoreductase n=1 Tax=Mycobacteriaceae TaxID=1762 RepID=UPI0011F0052D|nr:SDR family oxidoreductase [Mycobacterium sp. ELW1]QEN12949.1 SDR family NAD(P)-dependent oxidoreductase [Mycobacterium sp. ELW1]